MRYFFEKYLTYITVCLPNVKSFESACDGLSVVSERERQRRITSDTCKNLPPLNQTIYTQL